MLVDRHWVPPDRTTWISGGLSHTAIVLRIAQEFADGAILAGSPLCWGHECFPCAVGRSGGHDPQTPRRRRGADGERGGRAVGRARVHRFPPRERPAGARSRGALGELGGPAAGRGTAAPRGRHGLPARYRHLRPTRVRRPRRAGGGNDERGDPRWGGGDQRVPGAGPGHRGDAELGGPADPAARDLLGKALLAFLPAERRAEILAGPLTAFTGVTHTDDAALERELAQVREAGWARAVEELEEGLNAVAAPIRDHSGRVVAALRAAGPAYRLGEERLEAE